MSRIVTFEQGKVLKRLGFKEKVTAYYVDGSLDCNNPINWNTNEGLDENGEYQEEDEYCSAPTVSEALDWVREEKGVACGVHPYAIYEDMPDGDQHFVKWGYKYVAFQGLSEWQNMNKDVFDTHPLASSALLDAVLTYLEQKEKKQ